ncbi:putative Rho-type GTPase-activating protein 2 [Smittium culicis]|uniref:Putative Rho-type GTPase-activating protein 2 n=1 Tax=Smittium culicis TaxID=133412 RepID=A0A1R1YPW0_9FUNG|nr:putative Rho-type GTPase-activating protein 2 [Smittium culicis]
MDTNSNDILSTIDIPNSELQFDLLDYLDSDFLLPSKSPSLEAASTPSILATTPSQAPAVFAETLNSPSISNSPINACSKPKPKPKPCPSPNLFPNSKPKTISNSFTFPNSSQKDSEVSHFPHSTTSLPKSFHFPKAPPAPQSFSKISAPTSPYLSNNPALSNRSSLAPSSPTPNFLPSNESSIFKLPLSDFKNIRIKVLKLLTNTESVSILEPTFHIAVYNKPPTPQPDTPFILLQKSYSQISKFNNDVYSSLKRSTSISPLPPLPSTSKFDTLVPIKLIQLKSLIEKHLQRLISNHQTNKHTALNFLTSDYISSKSPNINSLLGFKRGYLSYKERSNSTWNRRYFICDISNATLNCYLFKNGPFSFSINLNQYSISSLFSLLKIGYTYLDDQTKLSLLNHSFKLQSPSPIPTTENPPSVSPSANFKNLDHFVFWADSEYERDEFVFCLNFINLCHTSNAPINLLDTVKSASKGLKVASLFSNFHPEWFHANSKLPLSVSSRLTPPTFDRSPSNLQSYSSLPPLLDLSFKNSTPFNLIDSETPTDTSPNVNNSVLFAVPLSPGAPPSINPIPLDKKAFPTKSKTLPPSSAAIPPFSSSSFPNNSSLNDSISELTVDNSAHPQSMENSQSSLNSSNLKVKQFLTAPSNLKSYPDPKNSQSTNIPHITQDPLNTKSLQNSQDPNNHKHSDLNKPLSEGLYRDASGRIMHVKEVDPVLPDDTPLVTTDVLGNGKLLGQNLPLEVEISQKPRPQSSWGKAFKITAMKFSINKKKNTSASNNSLSSGSRFDPDNDSNSSIDSAIYSSIPSKKSLPNSKSVFDISSNRNQPLSPPPKKMVPIFGAPLDIAAHLTFVRQNYLLPSVAYRCIEFLDFKNAFKDEGIYRLSGSSKTIDFLKQKFDSCKDYNLLLVNDGNFSANDSSNSNNNKLYFDTHDVASLLKLYLRSLPNNILTHNLFPFFSSLLNIENRSNKLKLAGQLILSLPLPNYTLLRALLAHLIRIIKHSKINLMTLRNIGIVFSPTLGIPVSLLCFFIIEFSYIFNVNNDTGIPEPLSPSPDNSNSYSVVTLSIDFNDITPHSISSLKESSN